MMRILVACVLVVHVATASCSCGDAETDGVEWRDELAQAACLGLQTQGGWMFAVRRNCAGKKSCADICESLSNQDGQAKSVRCLDAFHVYAKTHPCERGMANGAVEQLGIKTYRYHQCDHTNCGPNFCCCFGLK